MLIDWLKAGGNVGIHGESLSAYIILILTGPLDATNSSRARRLAAVAYAHELAHYIFRARIASRVSREHGIQVIFLESVCDEPDVIAANVSTVAATPGRIVRVG
jgi:6-phosphofructo-2-kinase/fructose-2,6-biphosphatase 2